ncbi:hypothetical protein SAMN05519104_5179 [Rhizobiales bacterium GAS188]|nr:hypothetical protein SAMN05519104_5179 [Rhizobiales bacterium GAS188]
MTGADIIGEYTRCALPGDNILRGLAAAGVDLAALELRWRHDPHLVPRASRVEYFGNRHFEFAGDRHGSIGALVFGVLDEARRLVDLCAWSPPRSPVLWLGRGSMLGAEQAFGPRMRDEIHVHRTPLGWLRNNCRGLVPIDPISAGDLLWRARPLLAEDQRHARELRAKTTRPPAKIMFRAAA